ncbi:hypothetical protein BGX21_005180, partial [Mortierella sp. AD011]
MSSIFDVPELASVVGQYLEPADLHKCVQVSKAWQDNLTQSLWRTFICNSTPEFPNAPSRIHKPTFLANSHHIRNIHSNDEGVITLVLLECARLEEVHVSRENIYEFTMEYMFDIFVPAMEANSNTIKAFDFRSFPSSTEETLGLLMKTLAPLNRLTHLSITFCDHITEEALMFLAATATQLHELFITFSVYRGSISGATLKLEQTKLKELRLITNVCDEEHMYFVPFLKASPDLQAVKFPMFKNSKAALILQTINQYCSKLCDIDLRRVSGLEDGNFADFMSAAQPSGLRKFSAHPKVSMGPKSIAALCSYTTTLQKVRVPAVGQASVTIILHLLRSCPNMRDIDAFSGKHRSGRLGVFATKELLSEPWVCLGLEVLCIPIVDVYSTDETGGADGKFDYHAELYSQLSQLIKLRKLNVGFNCSDIFSNNTSPLFSFKSGLRTLTTLKMLRLLDIQNTKIGIYREELEWMCNSWPHLESVKYKDEDCHDLWWRTEAEKEESEPPSLSDRAKA